MGAYLYPWDAWLRKDPLYKRLNDRKIKEMYLRARYERIKNTRRGAIGVNPSDITEDEARLIFFAALEDGTINDLEYQDLKSICRLAPIREGAKRRLERALLRRRNRFCYYREKRLKGSEMQRIYNALTPEIIGALNFYNPKFPEFRYESADFAAICRLIHQKCIRVYEYENPPDLEKEAVGRTVENARGVHEDRYNKLLINRKNANARSEPQRIANYKATVVHEVTHSVQDWKDWQIRRYAAEADSFVAGAVSFYFRRADHAYVKDHPMYELAFNGPARIIVDRKIEEKEDEYKRTYKQLMDGVANLPGFKEDKQLVYDFTIDYKDYSPKEREAKVFRKLVDTIRPKWENH